MTLNYACIAGRVKLVLYDDRARLAHAGPRRLPRPGRLLPGRVPPGVWTGLKGMAETSLVANCATHPHDPSRTDDSTRSLTPSRTTGHSTTGESSRFTDHSRLRPPAARADISR